MNSIGLRPALRAFQAVKVARIPLRNNISNNARPMGRRFQTTDAAGAEAQSIAQRIWNSPVGVKTVHFWAPVMKWAIVLAGISDFYRPAEKLSLTQNVALTCTGLIWTRWCLIIKPKNYLLAAVNFFLGCVGVIQVGRILQWQRSVKDTTAGKEVELAKENVVDTAKGLESDVKGALK